MWVLFSTAFLVALLYAPITIGLALAFRVLNYPDLTCEGSFMLGGALSSIGLAWGLPPPVAIALGVAGGFAAGTLTGLLHARFGVSRLLSGIVTSAILYSVTIRLLGGRANRRVLTQTIFDAYQTDGEFGDFVVAGAVMAITLAFCFMFYRSYFGRVLRALGDQEWFCVSLGRDPRVSLIVGLGVANSVVALSGATLVQFKRVCDVNMGFGVLIAGLGGLVLGETLFPARTVWGHAVMCLVGTAVYNVALGAFYFDWGVGTEAWVLPSDVRMVTGVLLILPAVVSLRWRRYKLFNTSW